MTIFLLRLTRLSLCAATLFVAAGCALHNTTPTLANYQERFAQEPPTTEWLRDNLQSFKDKSWAEPTKDNIAVYEFMAGELAKRDAVQKRADQWMSQTHRELTQDWGNTERGGAALRQPAYIHVLGTTKAGGNLTAASPTGKLVDPADMIATSLSKLNDIQKGKGYSVYELQRWERFCNHGLGMDKRDWAFVKKEGVQNVPITLIGKCSPPKKMK